MTTTIHIGLHKTGSTFLQRVLFRNFDKVNVYGRANKTLKNFDELDKDKINLISNEGYSCSMNFNNTIEKRRKKAKEIKKVFPDAKIIIVIRNKEKWVKSLYSEYIKAGGFRDYNYWYKHIFDEKTLNFDSYISFLKSLFSEVLVLKFETLKKDPELFVKKICDFIGTDVPSYENKRIGKRLSKRQMTVLRYLNGLFRTQYNEYGLFPGFLNPLMLYRRVDRLSNKYH